MDALERAVRFSQEHGCSRGQEWLEAALAIATPATVAELVSRTPRIYLNWFINVFPDHLELPEDYVQQLYAKFGYFFLRYNEYGFCYYDRQPRDDFHRVFSEPQLAELIEWLLTQPEREANETVRD